MKITRWLHASERIEIDGVQASSRNEYISEKSFPIKSYKTKTKFRTKQKTTTKNYFFFKVNVLKSTNTAKNKKQTNRYSFAAN